MHLHIGKSRKRKKYENLFRFFLRKKNHRLLVKTKPGALKCIIIIYSNPLLCITSVCRHQRTSVEKPANKFAEFLSRNTCISKEIEMNKTITIMRFSSFVDHCEIDGSLCSPNSDLINKKDSRLLLTNGQAKVYGETLMTHRTICSIPSNSHFNYFHRAHSLFLSSW